ncbi:protein smoothened [Ditylenchus destructor]|uniref:Protein smoothened n=1 Tax=Ditylenchus destructor TaxID=166010 RepID=A0AAD4R1N9_9BILA|nr:protein smoothened [Ditylenchus destructor]
MLYLLLVFAFILLDADGIAFENNLNSTLAQDAEKQNLTRLAYNSRIAEAIAQYNAGHLTHWEHNEQCRITLPYQGESTCRPPNKYEDLCFGTVITHNYTTGPKMESFPQHLEILSRFPRCWSQLSPLLCASHYRPCQLRAMGKESLIHELWEVFPTVFCTHAKQECEFLIKMNLWPDFLNCDDKINPTKLLKALPRNTAREDLRPYNDRCKVNYRGAPIKPKVHQCMWPLVTKSSNDVIVNAQPLIDDCYLPCRSTLYDGQRSLYFLATLGLASCFVTWTFLVWLSKVYEDHFSVFLLSNVLFSGLVYYAMLTLPYFDAVFESTVCTDSGRIRLGPTRIDLSKAGGALSLCALSSWLITVSFISMNAWIAAFLIHHILGTDSQECDYELPIKTVKGGRNPRIDPRRFHQLSIYLFASFYATTFSFLIDIPTDGQLGICHYGVGDISKIFIIYGPVYSMAFVVLVAFIGKRIWSNWKYRTRSNPNILRRRSKQSNGFEESIALPSRTDHEKPLVDPDDTDYQDANKQTQNVFSSAFFRCMAAAYFLSIFLSAMGQSLLFWERKPEYEAVLDSIRCSLKYTLFPPQPDNSWISESWKNDGLATSTVPYRRELFINSNLFPPGCDLESGPGSGHLFLYIFLYPALPILVVMLWFFIGWFFKTEYTEQLFVIRRNIIPCTRDKTNDQLDLESSHRSTPQLSIKRSGSQTEQYHTCAPQHYSQNPTMMQGHQSPGIQYQQTPVIHVQHCHCDNHYSEYDGDHCSMIAQHSYAPCDCTSQVQAPFYGVMIPGFISNDNLNPRTQPTVQSEPSNICESTENRDNHRWMNLESRYRQYHHENKKKDRKEELKQNAQEMRQYFDENMSDNQPKINPAPSATHVSNASNQQNPHLSYTTPAGWTDDAMSINSMLKAFPFASGPTQTIDPNQILNMVHAAGLRLANARPATPSSSSGENGDNEEECDDEDNEDPENVEDIEDSSTRYSDIYNSDEPGSGEERFFNEQVKTMQQQTQAKIEQVSNSARQPTGTNDAGPTTR